MANTFELIASSTVGAGGAASIDFTSIPSTYTDLVIYMSARTNAGNVSDQTLISFNGSTTSFTSKMLGGNGSSASSPAVARYTMPNDTTDQTANTFNNGSIYIPNYAGSTNKSYSADGVQENNATYALMWMTAGLWSNTAAINQITLTPSSGSYVQYTNCYLYGVKNA